MKIFLRIMALTLVVISSFSMADDTAKGIESEVDGMSDVIGFFPPAIETEKQKNEVQSRYLSLKNRLDTLISKSSSDPYLLYVRGKLQAMGHNFDYPGAFEAASEDLKASLTIKPNNESALLTLAQLWVNSDPNLAPEAEDLLIAAQCYHGAEPLEEAQFSMFFALYYQGRVGDAVRQAAYLKSRWPGNQQYEKLYDMAKSVLERNGSKQPKVESSLAMATCSGAKVPRT